MRSSRKCALFVTLLALASEGTALAAPLRVRFAAGSACADDAALTAQIQSRGLVLAEAGDASASDVEIDVRATEAGFEARMAVHAPGEPIASRIVTAATCDDVLRVFAFALAIALEQLPEPPARAEKPKAPPPAPASPPAPPTTPPAVAPSPAPTRLRVGLGASAGLASGMALAAAFTVGGFAELEDGREGRVLAPLIRVGALAMVPSTFVTSQIPVRFGLQSSRVDACPVRIFSALAIRPCLRLELGRTQTKSFGVPDARLESAIWATAELLLSARWAPRGPFFVEADAAGGPALARPTYVFRGAELFAVPVFVGEIAILAGLHFP